MNYKNLLVPGFIDSFGKSKIYHKLFSVPGYGKFSEYFHQKDTEDANKQKMKNLLQNFYPKK